MWGTQDLHIAPPHHQALFPQESRCLSDPGVFSLAELRTDAAAGKLDSVLSFCEYMVSPECLALPSQAPPSLSRMCSTVAFGTEISLTLWGVPLSTAEFDTLPRYIRPEMEMLELGKETGVGASGRQELGFLERGVWVPPAGPGSGGGRQQCLALDQATGPTGSLHMRR